MTFAFKSEVKKIIQFVYSTKISILTFLSSGQVSLTKEEIFTAFISDAKHENLTYCSNNSNNKKARLVTQSLSLYVLYLARNNSEQDRQRFCLLEIKFLCGIFKSGTLLWLQPFLSPVPGV